VDAIVRAVALHKTYNSGAVKVHALRGVDLEIPPGEFVAVMGPSGCGKTTLLNCLSGLDDVSEGDVFVEGVNLSEMDDDRRSEYRARRMGFVFQSYNLLPILSARENVELPLLVAGVRQREAGEVARRMLALVGLEGFAAHRPAELSAGQQQRVAIARALVNKPGIVWADEPTGNLDSDTSSEVLDLLGSLNEENGQTFVVVTHDASVAARAHRILRMKNGQIVEQVRGG
jgi:putative ABC transport system ATP-binding protein